jgi:anthraniloyl-CoA monooxygenase
VSGAFAARGSGNHAPARPAGDGDGFSAAVVGGGPAGLYFALLFRQAFPAAAVTVYERNRPDDTYGFGVVFSDETLGAFRDADPPSFSAISARFRRWDRIETFYRGTCTVSRGHGFAALSRRALLAILQERCSELGVELRFGQDVASLSALAGHDLVVVADGVNSAVRRELAAELRPTVEQGATRFCWLGTSRPLDAFTFLFHEAPTGLFQVHAYPYDDGMATWIVECAEDTWRRTGLAVDDEAATARACEALFGDFLRGHRLVANRSIWRTFPTVSCERWHHGNAVLLGDAVHTAHFSIGSGTKLAMEDAIALVAAFRDRGPADVAGALTGYEEARRVDVAKLQKAARTSREWFEQSARYLGQHPLQLSFNLMTRSKRITYDNLGERDPALVGAVDAWYRDSGGAPVGGEWRGDGGDDPGPADVVWRVRPDGSRADDGDGDGDGDRVAPATSRALPAATASADRSLAAAPGSSNGVRAARASGVPPPLFLPFRARSVELRNRVVVSPMCQYSAVDGCPTDWHLVHLGSRAVGGAGLVIAEMTDVSPEGRITPGCAGMYAEEHRRVWRRIVDFVHSHSAAKIGVQLAHAGRKGSVFHPWDRAEDVPLRPDEGAWETLAPSPLPYRPHWPAPREMGRADMERLEGEFVRATGWAAEAGFDWLELHMAHGYLLSSFLSPLSNQRRDDFGGSLENRMRWPLAVFSAMRDCWPEHLPMSVRISATDWMDDGSGFGPDDAVVLSRELARRGCDVVDVSTGGNSPLSRPDYGRMYQVPFADRIRHEAGIPVMAVGALLGADHANTVLAAGRADLAVMARPHLGDPYLTARAAARYGVEDPGWPGQYHAGRPHAETR